jgi:ribosome recycling factor
MAVSADEYLKALRDINLALTTGLQSAIAIIENYEKLTEEQRKTMIIQLKQLVESSHNVYRPEPTKH